MQGRVLVVNDDPDMCEVIAAGLSAHGYESVVHSSSEAALRSLDHEDFDVAVTDLRMPHLSGTELCERMLAKRPDLLVIVITAFGSMDTAVAAIRAGAYDFLAKPFEIGELRLAVDRAMRQRVTGRELQRLEGELRRSFGRGGLLGSSAVMRSLADTIERVAPTPSSVLITGESGTGKELVARLIHDASARKGPFVAVNCAAVPEGLLESELFGHVKGSFTDARNDRAGLFREAEGGTVLLDEIGEMPLAFQAKLLRALQERSARPVGGDSEYSFDTRVLAATHRDLESEIEHGGFREDLYFRINVIGVNVPPLRARGADVLELAHAFLDRFSARMDKPIDGIAPEACEKLMNYSWPGNVRELENCLERAVALARLEQIVVNDLPEKIRDYQVHHIITASDDPADLVSMEEVERRYIRRVLEVVGGNKSQAARVLGWDRKTLYRRLDKYRIDLD